MPKFISYSREDLAAVNTTVVQDGALAYVRDVRDVYGLLKQAEDAPDGVNIIEPTSDSPGRWFRLNVSQTAWQTESDWYVDEQNSTGLASDNNQGNDPSAPLLSYAELTRRIEFATLAQDTTVHLLSDVNDDSAFIFRGTIITPFVLRISGEAPVELLASSVLTGATNIVVDTTRPSIQITGINWTTAGPGGTSLVGRRCRVTASSGAQVGTVFWIEEVDPSDSSVAYISQPYFTAPPALGATQTLSVGDTIVVEDLTVLGRVVLQYTSDGAVDGSNLSKNVVIENVRGQRVANNTAVALWGLQPWGQGVSVYGSHVNYSRTVAPFVEMTACRWGSDTLTTALLDPAGGLSVLRASSIKAKTGGSTMTVFGAGALELYDNCSCTSRLQIAGNFLQARSVQALSSWSWSAAALAVSEGASLTFFSAYWGSSAVANSYGIQVRSGSQAMYLSSTPPTAAGAAGFDISVGGATASYAGLPAAGEDPAKKNSWLITFV